MFKHFDVCSSKETSNEIRNEVEKQGTNNDDNFKKIQPSDDSINRADVEDFLRRAFFGA